MVVDDSVIVKEVEMLWPDVAKRLKVGLNKKNAKVWRAIWDAFGEESYLAGFGGQIPAATATELAMQYFKSHGLELVKNLTETDLDSIKSALIENWGVGKEQFARIMKDEYIASESRLERIYISETHVANRVGQKDYQEEVGSRTKTWIATGIDGVCCDECMDMHNETVEINELYSNGSDVAHAHPNCMCTDAFDYTPKEG